MGEKQLVCWRSFSLVEAGYLFLSNSGVESNGAAGLFTQHSLLFFSLDD